VVAIKGTNDDELPAIARYLKERGHVVRLIEYMDRHGSRPQAGSEGRQAVEQSPEASGLDDIDGGRVLIDGESIHDMSDAKRTRHRAESMGFVFQAFNLISVFTAIENVELPLLLAGASASEARKRAEETLERVGLSHRMRHRPSELSGGEQQRVTVARALAGRPRVVWADEPTGNLDSETAAAVLSLLGELHREGLTIVLVTHDEAIGASAQRLVRMRDGMIVSDTAQSTTEVEPSASPSIA